MEILHLSESSLDDVVAFVVRLNQNNAHNIGYFGETEAEVRSDITAILPPEGDGYLAISDKGEITGLLGVEIDTELGRCWLLGPLVQHEAWDSVADSLYEKILAVIPDVVNDQELFFDVGNINLQQFAVRHGFAFYTEAVVLAMDKTNRQVIQPASDPEFDNKYTEEFTALHSRLFPNTYYSAEQLIKKARDKDKCLFFHITDGKFSGYIFIQARESSQDGFIDFIGVDERVRRKGIGKHLLSRGLNWAFSLPGVKKVTLTVKTSNMAAIRLYESLNFKVERTTKAFRKRS